MAARRHGQRGRVKGLVFEYCHKALSLGILYYANRALASACAAAQISFPSPLIGVSSFSCLVLHALSGGRRLTNCCVGAMQACLASSRCC